MQVLTRLARVYKRYQIGRHAGVVSYWQMLQSELAVDIVLQHDLLATKLKCILEGKAICRILLVRIHRNQHVEGFLVGVRARPQVPVEPVARHLANAVTYISLIDVEQGETTVLTVLLAARVIAPAFDTALKMASHLPDKQMGPKVQQRSTGRFCLPVDKSYGAQVSLCQILYCVRRVGVR